MSNEMDEFDNSDDDDLCRVRQWQNAVQATRGHTVIDYYDEPTRNRWGTLTVGEWRGYLIQVLPMIEHDLLAMTPKARPFAYEFCWSYPKGTFAFLAALTWNPDEFTEPHGHVKRVGPQRPAVRYTKSDAR